MLSEDVVIFPYSTITKMSADHTKSKVSDPKYGGGDTNLKRECWIKSDAECKPDIGAVEGKQCGMIDAVGQHMVGSTCDN
ncbi:hypothetical protein Tco_0361071 [Tanacetum coccineum]